MKGRLPGLVVVLACSAPLIAQERDRSRERIGLALQQPPVIVSGVGLVENPQPRTFGVFTMVPPTGPGELIRVSVPIGEFVSRAVRTVAAANHRRQESAARRRVQAELRRLEGQQTPSSR